MVFEKHKNNHNSSGWSDETLLDMFAEWLVSSGNESCDVCWECCCVSIGSQLTAEE